MVIGSHRISRRSVRIDQHRTLRNFRNNTQRGRNTPGTVSPKRVTALASTLKMSTDNIRSTVVTIDSKQNDYQASYFQGKNGPVVVIENLKNALADTLDELANDTDTLAREIHDPSETSQIPLPDEIYFTPNNDLEPEARQNLIENTVKGFNARLPFGKTYRRMFFNGYVKLKLADVPTDIEPKHQVMTPTEFVRAMGEQALNRPGHDLYNKVVKTLGDYTSIVAQKRQELRKKAENGQLSPSEFYKINQEIQDKSDALNSALLEYLDKGKSLKLPKSLLPRNRKYNAVKQLQQQLSNANPKVKDPNPQNEEPIKLNEALSVERQNYWIRTFNPLLDSHIIRDGDRLGEGAQGEVRSKVFAPQRPDFPSPFEAGVKFDNYGSNDEAIGAGIPQVFPEEAKRAVATYEVSQLLGLNVIPLTTFLLGHNNEKNYPKLGQAMQRVRGTAGQVTIVNERTLTPSEIATKQLNEYLPEDLEGRYKVTRDANEKIVAAIELAIQRKPVDVPLKANAVIQKELSDLQILDNVIGHADRHFGNFMFEVDDRGQISGVKGIDNDDTFGAEWVPRDKPQGNNRWTSKTPDIPPIVDAHTAVNIMRVSPNDLEPLRTKLTDDEYEATKKRLKSTQKQIIERIKGKRLAIMPNQTLSEADKAFLATAAELPDDNSLNQLLEWGDPMVYQAHLPLPNPLAKPDDAPPVTNSYLGEMIVLGRARGFAPWPNNA